MTELLPYLFFDLILVLGLPLLMWRQLSFWHPVVAYLFFHFYSFTWRMIGLINGDLPMYSEWALGDPIRLEEFQRAMVWADVALVIFCLASFIAHRTFTKAAKLPVSRRLYSRPIILAVCSVALPVGFTALFLFKAGFVTSVEVAQSGYFSTMGIWPIGCVGLLVFLYGFRWYLVAMGMAYLGVVAVQGYHRYMLVLPLILFTTYYLQARGRKWPTATVLIGAFALAMIFPKLKYIGRAYQDGDWNRLIGLTTSSFAKSKADDEDSSGQNFLDQYAGALTLIDDDGQFYKGATYLYIIALPIPRALWSGKPGLGDHIIGLSSRGRPYGAEGRIISYLGEAYINFGYLGFFLLPFILGYTLTRWCIRATSGPLRRFDRFLYAYFFMVFLQLFRDGMASLLVFTIVHNIPIFIIWMAHLVPRFRTKVLDAPIAPPGLSRQKSVAAANQ